MTFHFAFVNEPVGVAASIADSILQSQHIHAIAATLHREPFHSPTLR